MPSGQRHHRRLQSQPERRGGEQPRQPGAGPCATVPAARLMRAMLGHDHADRRQLEDLVAAEPPARTALLIDKPAPASATRVWVVIDDLIHLVLRFEIATRTLMPGLSTLRSALTLAAHQLLGLRPRLRPPLRARLGRIGRTAAWNSYASPDAPAPPGASADPRAARTPPASLRMNSTHASRPES